MFSPKVDHSQAFNLSYHLRPRLLPPSRDGTLELRLLERDAKKWEPVFRFERALL
jgi:hypothetical protein